ncbi:MAG: hypothetical protein IJ349_00375 [Clostridia bacterium]|nr:hypothetical protein [Clostridia bacterium]
MDEFEKRELETPDEEFADVSEEITEEISAESEEDALVKELEGIRDMFQEALDNAGEEQAEGELIQELEEIEDADEEHPEEKAELPLCECCAEQPVSLSYGEDYPYCESCRELMKRYPLRISGVISMLLMIVVFGLSVFFGLDSMENAVVVLEAQAAAGEGKMMSTVQSLYSFVSGKDVDSQKAVDLLIDGFIRTGYVNNAKETVEKYYTENQLKLPWNKKYKRAVEFVDTFLATRDAVQTIVEDAFSGKEFDCDKLIAELDKAKENYVDEEKGIRYSEVIIEYYKYELLRLSGAELEKQLEVLRGIEENDKNGFANWIYLPSICEVAGKMGNEELAKEYFEKMCKNNSEDMKAYASMALYYRYLEVPDGDAIIKLCETAASKAYSGDTSYYPALVIGYLIKGEGALALDTMTEYMSTNYYNVSNCNLYALCALYCGNTDIYNNMVQTLGSSGFEVSELVEGYKNGTVSLEEAIADMRGDIA